MGIIVPEIKCIVRGCGGKSKFTHKDQMKFARNKPPHSSLVNWYKCGKCGEIIFRHHSLVRVKMVSRETIIGS